MLARALLGAFLFAAPVAGAAQAVPDGLVLARQLAVSEPRARAPAIIRTGIEARAGRLYGGLRGRAKARDSILHSEEAYVRVRPRLGRLAVDVGYTRAIEGDSGVAVSLRHPLGAAGSLAARVKFDANTATARTEARTTIGALRLGGGISGRFDAEDAAPDLAWDVNAARTLADGVSATLRLENPAHSPPRASLSLAIRF